MASAGGLKRSLLVDLDKSEQPDFHGLRAIQLQGGALDPTKAREALAFALFPRGGRARPAHGSGRGDAHRSGRT